MTPVAFDVHTGVSHKDKDIAAFITVKSNRSTTQQTVTQDSNEK